MCWLDEEQMQGDINAKMTKGVDESRVAVVFITNRYITKAAGEGEGGADDNCKFEFDYALLRKGVQRMVAVVMEPDARNPKEWLGVVGGKLGTSLYVDLSADEGQGAWMNGVQQLVREIRDRAAVTVHSSVKPNHLKLLTESLRPRNLLQRSHKATGDDEAHRTRAGRVSRERDQARFGAAKTAQPESLPSRVDAAVTAEDPATKPVSLPAPWAETNPQLSDGIATGALPSQAPVDKPVDTPSDREYTQVASRVQEEGLPVLLSRLSRSVSNFFITEEDLKLPTETAAKSDVTERGQPASSSNSVALAGGQPTGTQGMLVTDLEA